MFAGHGLFFWLSRSFRQLCFSDPQLCLAGDYIAVLWKSSVLPLLVGQLEIYEDHDLTRLSDVDGMIDMSKEISVVMEAQNPPVFSEH